ncbi:hypothetical protein B0J13DRAFT_522889 [Dactylonectria estremocensis]|uniref:Uncharacterized protein n=1 Tax=Dactylonectria estremocensis TaxID=1079267 RepID=A0A9P9F266_9HYPO|nr:hypothetical protein B0J13DRAFT_522889 [Dactylonectria estremocensis]
MVSDIDAIPGWLNEFHMQRSRGMPYGVPPPNQMPQRHYYASRIMSESSQAPRSANSQVSWGSASSSSDATSYPSLFDQDIRTVSSKSSNPASIGPPRNHQHRPNLGPGPSRLPCEFIHYHGCQTTFDADDQEGWIAHVAYHLGNNFPAHCICWFCDREFVAQSNSPEDCWFSYHTRMSHIAGHFRDQGLQVAQMRPDFFFLDHLRHHMLISDDEFYRATSTRHELPQIPNLHPRGWRPEIEERGVPEVETHRSSRRRGHRSSRTSQR